VKCPKCKSKTIIINTRETSNYVRRRHECKKCKFRFTTYEVIKNE